jgi:hypothetical protein
MKNQNPIPFEKIQRGDVLLYGGNDILDRLIQLKTWSDVAHIEIYAGCGKSVASRNGLGVDIYPFRTEGLRYILRANEPFSWELAWDYFLSVQGQGYDWKDLLCFILLTKNGSIGKQICSEFATNLLRAGKLKPFDPFKTAKTVAPSGFLDTPALDEIWNYKDGEIAAP